MFHLTKTSNVQKQDIKSGISFLVNQPFILMSNCEDGEKFTKEEMVFSDGSNKKKKSYLKSNHVSNY